MAKIGKKTTTKKRRSSTNYSGAFVIGSVLGGLAGAAAMLWKTPQSGAELRARLGETFPVMGSSGSTLEFSTAPASPRPEGVKAPGEASGEPPAEGIGHPASTEELVTPPSPEELAQPPTTAQS